MPTPPAGYVQVQLYVHPDDRAAWRRASADANLTLTEWMRGMLNLAAGVEPRATGRRKKGPGPLSELRLPVVEAAASAMVPQAPSCTHVPRGGYCNRCGAVRP